MTCKENYSLLAHNTFGIDACCKRFMEYSSHDEALTAATALSQLNEPWMVIGAGSNLLLTRNYQGTVVHSAMRGISMTEDGEGNALLRCGSGETWDDVVDWTARRGFYDLVNLSLIPGDVGASAVQNIGAYGAEAAQTIAQVHAIDISTQQPVTLQQPDCRYGYRDSRFKHEWKGRYLITQVDYRLHRHTQPCLDYGNIRTQLQQQGIEAAPTPMQLRQTIIDIRRNKLPDHHVTGNAGSFFVNPVVSREQFLQLQSQYPQMPHYHVDEAHEKIPAAWLIEQCGWKGRHMGRAGVHHRQPLVLVNLGGATGSDILQLCQAVSADVASRFGISLQPEVNIV